MNRAKVQNLLPVAVTSSAAVTEEETNPFTRNFNLSIYSNSFRHLLAMSVTPDSS